MRTTRAVRIDRPGRVKGFILLLVVAVLLVGTGCADDSTSPTPLLEFPEELNLGFEVLEEGDSILITNPRATYRFPKDQIYVIDVEDWKEPDANPPRRTQAVRVVTNGRRISVTVKGLGERQVNHALVLKFDSDRLGLKQAQSLAVQTAEILNKVCGKQQKPIFSFK